MGEVEHAACMEGLLARAHEVENAAQGPQVNFSIVVGTRTSFGSTPFANTCEALDQIVLRLAEVVGHVKVDHFDLHVFAHHGLVP